MTAELPGHGSSASKKTLVKTVTLLVEITRACNAKCSFCYNPPRGDGGGEPLRGTELADVIDRAAAGIFVATSSNVADLPGTVELRALVRGRYVLFNRVSGGGTRPQERQPAGPATFDNEPRY